MSKHPRGGDIPVSDGTKFRPYCRTGDRNVSATRWLFLLLLFLAAVGAYAHPANIAAARAKVSLDGTFEIKVRFDLLSYCLDLPPTEVQDAPMNALLDGPEGDLQASLDAARAKFERRVQVLGDNGAASVASLSFPTASDVQRFVAQTPQQRLPVMLAATLTGHLPKGARSIAIKFPDALGTVVLTSEFPYQEPVSEPVEAGSTSTPIPLPSQADIAATQAAIRAHAAAADPFAGAVASAGESGPKGGLFAEASAEAEAFQTQVRPFPGPETSITPQPASPPMPTRSWFSVFGSYIKMGFRHIVPEGLDHILFVLGLFLLSTRTKDLLKQITAFTVAHSLTLGLSLYGVVRLPSTIVEPIIALSIVFVAVENLCTTKMHKWRIGVVFLFGLVHGLGFASALKDLGLARHDFLTALVGFNSGVELGQLSVVAAAFLLVGWFRSSARYRTLIAMPASLLIALTAAIWTVQRLI